SFVSPSLPPFPTRRSSDLVIVQRAADLSVFQLGAVLGAPGVSNEWWHYLAAPFVYDDLGYLFVIGLAVAIFVPELERRLSPVPRSEERRVGKECRSGWWSG